MELALINSENTCLASFKFPKILCIPSSFKPLSFKTEVSLDTACSDISSSKLPSNKASFISFNTTDFSLPVDLLKVVFNVGNILSISLSKFFTNSIALFVSAMVAPLSAIFSSKTFCGLAPLALTVENILLKNLSSCELLYSKFLPLVAAALIPLAAPYTIGVIKIDSLPNLTLFNNFLPASSLPPSSVTLVN